VHPRPLSRVFRGRQKWESEERGREERREERRSVRGRKGRRWGKRPRIIQQSLRQCNNSSPLRKAY